MRIEEEKRQLAEFDDLLSDSFNESVSDSSISIDSIDTKQSNLDKE